MKEIKLAPFVQLAWSQFIQSKEYEECMMAAPYDPAEIAQWTIDAFIEWIESNSSINIQI